jgi:catechol 2,3-dioxygenase-like lactoylglutathione lyase family enzyme
MKHLRLLLLVAMLMIVVRLGAAQEPATGFHHVHLNSVNPAAAINFYTKTFAVTKQTSLAGWDAVQSEQMYLLFNRVNKPPAATLESAIWHFGWGSTAMEADYQRHLAHGVSFATPLTRLNANLLFAYMQAPDGALVEINTANTTAFLHVHLYSAAPLCAADWYVQHLGATSRAQRTGNCDVPFGAPSEPLGVIRAPATTVRFGAISLIIYPRQRPVPLVSPRGRVVDHFAFSIPDLDATLKRLRAANVKVLADTHPFGKSAQRAALIEGPDAVALELVEVK